MPSSGGSSPLGRCKQAVGSGPEQNRSVLKHSVGVLALGFNYLTCHILFLDLVPKENVESWLRYLRNEFPTVAFKASTQTQADRLVS